MLLTFDQKTLSHAPAGCPDVEGYVEATAQSLADTEAFIVGTKAANEALGLPAGSPPLVAPVVTPRFLPTCTPELLHGLGALAEKHDCFIQVSAMESHGVQLSPTESH